MGINAADENSSRAEAATPEEPDAAEKLARRKALEILVLSNANNRCYKEIMTMIHNDFMMGVKKIKPFNEAVRLLNNCKTCKPVPTRNKDSKKDVAFMEKEDWGQGK